jgi:hypothetical protein
MNESRPFGRSQSFPKVRFHLGLLALITAVVIVLGGCGGSTFSPSLAPSSPPSVIQNASVSGRYDVVLTSTNGHGTTSIYTNFTQTGATFTGAENTVVCPISVSQCVGDDSPIVSIVPSGSVSGADVTIVISFPGATTADTVTMAGTAKGPGTDITGTYTDTLGDAGSFNAFAAGPGGAGTYSGTFNSTPNPLTIAPTILITLAELPDGAFHLSGTATIMNSPCISSLTLSGEAVGDALKLTDDVNKAHILIVPGAANYIFSYSFESDAPSCAGDFGTGKTDTSPWDYLQPRR